MNPQQIQQALEAINRLRTDQGEPTIAERNVGPTCNGTCDVRAQRAEQRHNERYE